METVVSFGRFRYEYKIVQIREYRVSVTSHDVRNEICEKLERRRAVKKPERAVPVEVIRTVPVET